MRLSRTAAALSALALAAGACGGSSTTDDVGSAGDDAGDVAPATSDGASNDAAMDDGALMDDDDAAVGDGAMGDGMAMDDGAEDDDHAAADGGTDPAMVADRVIMITMTEFAFTPDVIEVAIGETVQFVFTNTGVIEHEAVLGDVHVQDEHEVAMQAMDPTDMGDMDHGAGDDHHGAIPSVTVLTGAVGTFTHTFVDASELLIGCHLPGHWDAGMLATIRAG